MAAINILTDLFVLILPISPALSLNINRRKKGMEPASAAYRETIANFPQSPSSVFS
jgi:hypothetical protein